MGKSLVIMGADFETNAIGTNRAVITYALTNTETTTSPSAVVLGSGLSLQFDDTNFGLPSSVAVTYTDSGDAVSGVNYNASTGVLTIQSVDGDITITAAGTVAAVTYTKADCAIVGGIYATDGAYASTFNLWKSTDWIDVSVFSNYNLDVNSPANSFGLAWYDTNKTFISGIKYGQSQKQDSGSIPSGAKYVRFCYQYSGGSGGEYATLVLS